MSNSWERLGKLSIAILEGFVESKLGEKFVELTREPTDRFNAISIALENTENTFREIFTDKGFSRAIFDDLRIDKEKLIDLIGRFFDHPNEPNFPYKIANIIAPELIIFTPDQVIKAMDGYVKILTQELSNVDEDFRSKITALKLLEIADNIQRFISEQKVIVKDTIAASSFGQEFISNELPPVSDILPKGCKILPRNQFFVNREDLLKKLWGCLLGGISGSSIAVITGTMRGVGKTQLALHFCYHCGKSLDGIHWIDAQQAIEAEIAGQGERMGLTRISEETSLLTQTLKAWQEAPNRLIILDNVDKPEILQDWLSQLSGLKILITAQFDIAGTGVVSEQAIFRVDELTEEHSIKLFKKLAPHLEQIPDEKIKDVAEVLGHLPLAIDLAGRYLKHDKDLTLEKYKELLNARSLDHLSLREYFSPKELNPTRHIPSLYDTFALSWNELDSTKNRLARIIFMFAGYLAPNTVIPKSLFYILADSRNDEDRVNVTHSLEQLKHVGLFREENALHPLLSKFAQIQAKDTDTLEILFSRISSLSKQILWNKDDTNSEETSVISLLKFEDIRPHLETLASIAKDSSTLNTRDLWVSLGDYYYQDAIEYSSAKKAYRFALDEERSKNEGKAKDLIAKLYHKIGRIHHILFEKEEAEECYLNSIEIWGDTYGKDDPGISIFLSSIGDLYKDIRKFGFAYQNVRRAYMIDKKEEADKDTARDLNSLGEILLEQHDLKNAFRLFNRAMDLYQEVHKSLKESSTEVDLGYAQSACNLGEVFRQQSDLDNAKTLLLEHAIQVYEPVYNKKGHPNLANCYQRMGAVFQDEDNIEEAKGFYNRALTIYQKYFPPKHPYIQKLHETLATCDQTLSRFTNVQLDENNEEK
jgi:tetratricopeptide (TPR) repeat protein